MMAHMPQPFDADAYWSTRLGEHWDLQGVGHQEYSAAYNRWLYRRKHAVLRRAIRGVALDSALDLGSGTGWVVAELKAAGDGHVEGCELTEVAVERLRQAFPDDAFHRVDIGSAPLPAADRAIDLVTMLDVSYHLVDDVSLRHVVGEIARVLRPGGVALVTDDFAGGRSDGGEHVDFRGLDRWRTTLAGLPLVIDKTLPYFKALSRPRAETWRHWWHPAIRGPVEWAMDTALPLRPWLRLAVLRRTAEALQQTPEAR
jgi:SAM-dependent methyltransferase